MKSLPILFAGLAAVFLSSCSTTPKENYQQAIEFDLVETTISMKTLNALDSGDVAKARRVAIIPVFTNFDSMRIYTIKGMASLTPEQRQEWTKVAREALDYMLRHRDEWDSRRLDVQAGIRGLRHVLTEPEDILRLKELADYFAAVDKKMPEKQKP